MMESDGWGLEGREREESLDSLQVESIKHIKLFMSKPNAEVNITNTTSLSYYQWETVSHIITTSLSPNKCQFLV